MASGGREIKNSTCCLSQLKVHFTQAAGVKCTAVVQLYQERIKGGKLELELTYYGVEIVETICSPAAES